VSGAATAVSDHVQGDSHPGQILQNLAGTGQRDKRHNPRQLYFFVDIVGGFRIGEQQDEVALALLLGQKRAHLIVGRKYGGGSPHTVSKQHV
jgi:hypothetical protein